MILNAVLGMFDHFFDEDVCIGLHCSGDRLCLRH